MLDRIRRVLAAALLAVAFWASPAASDDDVPRAWNQAEATAVAKRLADKADAFNEEIRKLPPDGSLTPLTKDEMDLVLLRARHLDERTRALAASLEEGQDRAETRSSYENVETTLRDVAEHTRSEWIPNSAYRTWAELRNVHLELAEYYGDHDVDPRLEDIRVEPRR